MKTLLIVRLCASESYDTRKIMRYVNCSNSGVSYIQMYFEYNRLTQNPTVLSLSLRASEMLERREKKDKLAIMDVQVTNFDTFSKLASMLKNRYYDHLEMIVLVDHPIKFFNDFCAWPDKDWLKKRYRRAFFERGLYRIDKLIDIASKISGKEVHVVASNNALENEQNVLNIADMSWCDSLEALPHPKTHGGKDVARLYFMPRLNELFSLDEWRAISMRCDNVVTRSALPEEFERLNRLIEKHWRYIKKRYPVLEKALIFDAAALCVAPEYDGPDLCKLARMLPKNFAGHFGYLRNGFTGLQARLFNEFKHPKRTDSIPKCSVITFAYNQEKYIAECIESVAAQDVDCEIEHVIFDDASTDSTPNIISEYAKKYPHIKPVLLPKKPPTTINLAFQSCRSEYVALCDGDDFFSDPLKLRKQIAFLDENPDFSMCFHYTEVFYDDGRKSDIYPSADNFRIKRVYSINDLLQGNPMQTSSVMYRWRFRAGLPSWFNPFLRPADWYWHLLHAENGPAGFIPEIMSKYRRHTNACYASADKGDAKAHRLIHGMRELEVYDILDRHFKLKYHKDFSRLATGVFANYLQEASENGNTSYIDKATSIFPDFAKDFLSNLTTLNKN